ncbi:hypothetical protein C7405_102124 [Paraburkholderia caballeronis]|uniref:hypothetical protein n=1 Tax=Paraburkholderia caballeronis TaxID=416943 RepID=UPI00106634C3|nr:hypothetical protein [Paraburkholderia caballeronis]TDV37924.1 hypothetical protein C7405_102124 [Paraburkholderia caballeronis]
MGFRWNQRFPPEYAEPDLLPAWVYVTVFVVLLCLFAGGTIFTWPKGTPVDTKEFLRTALVAPVMIGITIGAVLHVLTYDDVAYEAAHRNAARWHLLTHWHQQGRAGLAVLDSVILTPEPDLAERLLKLEGSPPNNPGRVMALDSVVEREGKSRRCVMLEKLLTPLIPELAGAMHGKSFDIVLQCEDEEPVNDVREVWRQLELPGEPRIHRIGNETNPGFADVWFKGETYTPYTYHSYGATPAPKYRLVLAWHLNDEAPEAPKAASEAAVALLLGTGMLMSEKPDTKRQAWLLRQIESEADQVDKSLGLLLRVEQVKRERIRHFWHSRLKGLALHATLGAVRDSGLAVAEHALDPAIGPQAPVARWLLAALAARMAHFGQGAQLIALPDQKGVILNLVVKDPDTVNVPWQGWYRYMDFIIPAWHLVALTGIWASMIVLSPKESWGTLQTVVSCAVGLVAIGSIAQRLWSIRGYRGQVWNEYG